jgi:hypothetical protein
VLISQRAWRYSPFCHDPLGQKESRHAAVIVAGFPGGCNPRQ